jgi:hypothetical protein
MHEDWRPYKTRVSIAAGRLLGYIKNTRQRKNAFARNCQHKKEGWIKK